MLLGCSATKHQFCALLLRELRAGVSCNRNFGQSFQLIKKRHPAIERLTSGRKRGVKKDFVRSDVSTSFGVFCNLIERAVEDCTVFAKGLLRNFKDCANDQLQR